MTVATIYGRIGDLKGPRVLENNVFHAATIRNHEPILEIAKTLEEGELPQENNPKRFAW